MSLQDRVWDWIARNGLWLMLGMLALVAAVEVGKAFAVDRGGAADLIDRAYRAYGARADWMFARDYFQAVDASTFTLTAKNQAKTRFAQGMVITNDIRATMLLMTSNEFRFAVQAGQARIDAVKQAKIADATREADEVTSGLTNVEP